MAESRKELELDPCHLSISKNLLAKASLACQRCVIINHFNYQTKLISATLHKTPAVNCLSIFCGSVHFIVRGSKSDWFSSVVPPSIVIVPFNLI